MTKQAGLPIHLNFVFSKTVQRAVEVVIGIGVANHLGAYLSTFEPDKVFIVCDTHVAQLYVPSLAAQISELFETQIIIHQPDEHGKKIEAVAQMSNEFFARGGTGRSLICAVGGGITGNMAGLLATLVYRGIALVHVPTTLLAQVDSAADVKQSVNAPLVKNAIGAYKAPDLVVIDPHFLRSLSSRELTAGIGEAVKHGLAQDMQFVDYILSADLADPAALEYIAANAIRLKLEHWKQTPTIWNDKTLVHRLTHLGHTTGKILEMIQIDYLTHGEAIAHGMVIEAYASHSMGYLDKAGVVKIYDVLKRLNLLVPLSASYTSESILSGLYGGDKSPVFALLTELGNPRTLSTPIDRHIYKQALDWYFRYSNRN